MLVTYRSYRLDDNRPHIKVILHGEHKRAPMDALIDTGAQSTCIANEKADQLDLPVLGQTTIKGATGEIETNTYKIKSIELQRGFH